MPFFDRVSVHSALQVLLNVVLQLFALLLACLTSYVPSIAFAISVSMAVSPRVTNRERLNGFFFIKFDIANCNQICWYIPILIISGNSNGHLT